MNHLFQKFYKGFYLRTGGYLPSKPINQPLYPGDFFQIKNGEIIVLGNIYRKSLIALEHTKLDSGLKLNAVNWEFNEGVTKPYSGREVAGYEPDGEMSYSKQVLAFKNAGSYLFKGAHPEVVKIANWQEIQQELILKLTQSYYSFRELYLVTECVTTKSWTLAIASDEHAELEIATSEENFGLADIFGSSRGKTIQSKNIEYYHRQEERVPNFFKAKKLQVYQEKFQVFISDLINERMNYQDWAKDFFDYGFFHTESLEMPHQRDHLQTSVLDMLQANQLNPNTALQYFHWGDLNLDDVQKLFITYGNE
ncbi:MAG: hypothetical protein R2793_00425 [Flavobacteriaceae bacterium]